MVKRVFNGFLLVVGIILVVVLLVWTIEKERSYFYTSKYAMYSRCVSKPMPYEMFTSLSESGVATLFTNTRCDL